jgi:flagellar hook-associated protein 3 FlgL
VVVYNGDQGQRLIQVSQSRQIAVNDAGADVFQRIPNGNGSFAAVAGANAGTALIDAGNVLDASKWNVAANSKNLTVKFAVNAGITTYDVIDNAAGGVSLLAAPRAYVSGSAIKLGMDGPPAVDFGAQVAITGTPTNNDTFAINASTHQDVFKTIDDLAKLLQNSSGATLANGLAAAQLNLDNALDNVATVRASTGSRMKELEAVKSNGDDRALQYSQTLSSLQDVDYAKAASELTQQQVNLEAAQKSFARVSGLSLFNYL